jgi:peptidyl-prolyl cis-trans isomerase C
MHCQRKKTTLTSLLLAAIFASVLPGILTADTGKAKKSAVARVNDSYIPREDYLRQFNIAQQQFIRQGVPLDEERMVILRSEVLEDLIDNRLLFQESRKRGYGVDVEAVETRYQEVKDQFPDDAEFIAALEEMQYTEDSFKEAVERRLTLEKLIENDISPGVTVSDEEVRQYYEQNTEQFVQPKQVRASHILIIVEDQGNEEQKRVALEKIRMVQQKLREGEDFAALAKQYSEGPSNVQGGDLGFFQRGQMVKPFEDAAFATEVGKVSDVVETRFGFHLILVTDTRPEVAVPFEYAEGSIVQFIKQNKIMDELGSLIIVLKNDSVIERYPENM